MSFVYSLDMERREWERIGLEWRMQVLQGSIVERIMLNERMAAEGMCIK